MSLPKIIQRLTEIYETYGKQHQEKLYEFIDKELPERMKLHLQREHRREQLEQKSDYYINNFYITEESSISIYLLLIYLLPTMVK